VAVIGACLLGMAFLGLRVVEARRDRIANEGFAIKALEFALDLYEEDVVRLERDAAALQENLPSKSGWTYDALSQQQAEACSQALVGLAAVRRGQPFAALSELKACLTSYESLEENERVPIMNSPFEILVGMTCLETVRMVGQRGQIYSAEFTAASGGGDNLRLQATERMREAILNLQLEIPKYPVKNRELLNCALLADLARHSSYRAVHYDDKDKSLSKTEKETKLEEATRIYLQCIDNLDQAAAILESLPERDERWWSQFARVLNIRMLVESRYYSLEDLPSQYGSMAERLASWSEQTQLVADYVEVLPLDRGRAVRFELAICYSNWADCYRDIFLFDYPQPIKDDDFAEHRRLRMQALRILEVAPRQVRSERHIENLALNHSRDLFISALFSLQKGQFEERLPELTGRARRLHLLLGDLLNAEVGQVNAVEAILAAKLLQDVYSPERVDAYVKAYRDSPSKFSRLFYDNLMLINKALDK
jgi:tetratricopeptide (TPR) repeat protein